MPGGKGKSGGKTGGKGEDSQQKTAKSHSAKAGLQFPCGRIKRHLRNVTRQRHGRHLLTSVLEYLIAEVLELAGNPAKDLKGKRITPRHLQLAIRGDEELDALVHATVALGGVLPHINRALLLKVEQKKGKKAGHLSSQTTPRAKLDRASFQVYSITGASAIAPPADILTFKRSIATLAIPTGSE
ncbi:histone-fold-containing protein [Phyllosticta capitalensis]